MNVILNCREGRGAKVVPMSPHCPVDFNHPYLTCSFQSMWICTQKHPQLVRGRI